jgi:hypothetical protein
MTLPQPVASDCTELAMRVIVQLRDDRDAGPQGAPGLADLARVLDDYALEARRLDPETDDPALDRFYVIDVPPDRALEDLLIRLRALDGVEAAYAKPPDEMP